MAHALAAALLLAGCALPGTEEAPRLFTLSPTLPSAQPVAATAPPLQVAPATARAGFDTPRMIYLRREFELEPFAHSQWVDAPARMWTPLLVSALERDGRVRPVPATLGAEAPYRLDTEIVALEQDFRVAPSQVRFVVRAELQDAEQRHVLASREVAAVVAAPSDDAYGGVLAANEAVARALGELASWLAQALQGR